MTASHDPTTGWDPEREEIDAEAAARRRPGRRARRWWVAGGVALLAAMAMVVWFALSATEDAVVVKDIGFERPSDREIVMIFDVTREPGTELTCTITAMDGEYARVGTSEHRVPASSERTTRVRASVRTTTTAATATADSCTPVD